MKANGKTFKTRSRRLSRAELLAALETQIADITATSSSAGWNYWAIIGAAAALLWLAIEAWTAGEFYLPNVFLLTLAITVTWDLLRSLSKALDQPPVTFSKPAPTFRPISRLLAATRSALVFQILKHAAMIWVAYTIYSPFLIPLQIYSGMVLFGSLLNLSLSYLDAPPQGGRKKPKFLRLVKVVTVFVCLFIAVVLCATWHVVWLHSSTITPYGLRLALLMSAIVYLVAIAIESRTPQLMLMMLRSLRQNVSFGRLPLAEAQAHLDLIYIGTTFTKALQPKFAEVVSAYQNLSVALTNVDQLHTQIFRRLKLLIEEGDTAKFLVELDAAERVLVEATRPLEKLLVETERKVLEFKSYHSATTAFTEIEEGEGATFNKEIDEMLSNSREQTSKLLSSIKSRFSELKAQLDLLKTTRLGSACFQESRSS